MKLSEVLNYINSALNYPAITYIDVDLFFDMAISELNTTLHTSLPLVKNMVSKFRQKVSKYEPNKVILTEDPYNTNFIIPTDPEISLDSPIAFYYSSETKKFYIYDKVLKTYAEYPVITGVYNSGTEIKLYSSINYGNVASWAEVPVADKFEAELGDYLPDDWIMLWLIPYVCYKYTVRDGGTAQTFAEELSQGFQQLQETYNIPSTVNLATYAGYEAYSDLVVKHLPNLNVQVPTKAIYESMKHSRNTNAIFGSFYDRGGF